VVLVRGYSHDGGDGAAAELVMDRELDLFP
jgi:hypothetical protein